MQTLIDELLDQTVERMRQLREAKKQEGQGEFSVYRWPSADRYERVLAFVPAKTAVETAKLFTDIGTPKVIITDGGDSTVFLWEDGKVIFPSKAELQEGGIAYKKVNPS